MNEQNEDIKKNLLELYEILYYACQDEATAKLFNQDILKQLKYEPDKVKEALLSNGNKPKKMPTKKAQSKAAIRISPNSRPVTLSQIISDIKTKEQVETYLNENLLPVCRVDITEEERYDILKHVSIDELKYLYEIVYGIPLVRKCKKTDIVYKIKRFYDDKKRATDLSK